MKLHNGHMHAPFFDLRLRTLRLHGEQWNSRRAAEWAGVNVYTIRRWVLKGYLTPLANGRHFAFDPLDVMRLYVLRSLAGSIRAISKIKKDFEE